MTESISCAPAVAEREVYSTRLLRRVRRQCGANIHRARAARRLTLRKLSQLSGVPEWRIDQYELGKGEIKLEDMLRLACALKLDCFARLLPDELSGNARSQ